MCLSRYAEIIGDKSAGTIYGRYGDEILVRLAAKFTGSPKVNQLHLENPRALYPFRSQISEKSYLDEAELVQENKHTSRTFFQKPQKLGQNCRLRCGMSFTSDNLVVKSSKTISQNFISRSKSNQNPHAIANGEITHSLNIIHSLNRPSL